MKLPRCLLLNHKINQVKSRGQPYSKSCDHLLAVIATDAFTCNSVQRIFDTLHIYYCYYLEIKLILPFCMKWHAFIFGHGFFSCCLTTGRSVCASRNQYVYFVAFFFPLVQFLQRKNIFNGVILCMAAVFILK